MIDHMTLTVRDLERSKTFYTRALAPLGYGILMSFEEMVGFGDEVKPYFWIKQGGLPTPPMHIAFRARERAAVDAFHAAALAAGGRDEGKPGLRVHYHPNYYGAFIIDPDGHPIEAVNHVSSQARARAKAKKAARARAGKRAARSRSAKAKSRARSRR
jgi:catechol 2,3-dioxygenase-like lactoylglutathione lyase family enzyme